MKEISRKRAAPVLSKENYKEWFKIIEDYLQIKGADDVLKYEISPAVEFDAGSKTPSTSSSTQLPELKFTNREWLKLQAEANYQIRICVGDVDRERC